MTQTFALRDILNRINRTTLGAAVAVVALLVVVSSFGLGVWSVADASRAQARVLSESLLDVASLQDRDVVAEKLRLLKFSPNVVTGALYGPDGHLSATYLRDGEAPPQLHDPVTGQRRPSLSRIVVEQVAGEPGNQVRLVLTVSLGSVYEQTVWVLLVTVVAALLSLRIGCRLRKRLNAQVLNPLGALHTVMQRVSLDGDYSVRVEPGEIAELATLSEGFNALLEQIHERDRLLAAQRRCLGQEVAARTAQLQQAKEAAEAASQAESEFLVTISHAIVSPMNDMLGMNERLLNSPLQLEQREWALAVRNSGRRLLSVMNDFLDFSKLKSGSLVLEEADLDLLEVVEEAALMFAQLAAAKGLELVVQVEPSSATLALRGDANRLRQVIAHLISNAIKFTSRGEILVRVALVEARDGEAAVQISVRDTGVGIAPEAQERIFEHFSQADVSPTRRYTGTGLGLAICRRLLSLMGGSIRVESQQGKGATFIVELQMPWARSLSREPLVASPLVGRRALVVVDNRVQRSALQQQLTDWQSEVISVGNAMHAQAAISEAVQAGKPFDFAILDMHLPMVDTLAMARALVRVSKPAPLRLIGLQSSVATFDPQACAASGIETLLTKPVRRGELMRVISLIVSNPKPAESTPPVAATLALHAQNPKALPQLRGQVPLVKDNPTNRAVAMNG